MSRKLILSAALAFASTVPATAQDQSETPEIRLSRTIDSALEAEGGWLLPAERALIDRKCGYVGEDADRGTVSMSDGVLICSNGRRVDDPEVRAMVEVAGERISRRVHAVMESPAVRNAIAAVSDEAVREALESLRETRARRGRR
jgi:hypothetical protein